MAVRYDYRQCGCGRTFAVQIDEEGEAIDGRRRCHVCAPPVSDAPYVEVRRRQQRTYGRRADAATMEAEQR